MHCRVISMFLLFLICFIFMGYQIYNIINDNISTDISRNTVTLLVHRGRGDFYDCKMNKLTGIQKMKKAVLVSTPQVIDAVQNNFNKQVSNNILKRLSFGKPIILEVGDSFHPINGVNIFSLEERYDENQLAVHLIGHLDNGANKGMLGLEKVYQNWLSNNSSEIKVTYDVDALGRVLCGNEPKILKKNINSKCGVQLTIDKEIQKICEKSAENLPSGAIVVMEVDTGKLRAVVSTPSYDPNYIEKSLNQTNAPFINRAFQAYSLGSIFKVVDAAAALENDVLYEKEYFCSGKVMVGEKEFQCYRGKSHGKLDLCHALEKSCNCYFIELAKQIGGKKLLEQAKKMGLGSKTIFADQFSSSKGYLPTLQEIDSDAALANLAFGQGKLLVTPIQVAKLICCIANHGYCIEPSLIEGLIDAQGNIIQKNINFAEYKVLSQKTADTLALYLIEAMENNYSHVAMPICGRAGGKTATAQSGWISSGREILHTWFAGFYPAKNPKYVIVIMNEDGRFGATDCCPIFKDIADQMYLKKYVK